MSEPIEFMDIVDDTDQIIGQASKSEIYEKQLLHRIVHVLIFDDKGRLALQLRSKQVKFCPNHWSTTVGGHVQAGETYKEAALRETMEEIGLGTKKIHFLFKKSYHPDEGISKFLSVFEIDAKIYFKPNQEVEKIQYFTMEEIKKMIKRGEKFHPELLFILRGYIF